MRHSLPRSIAINTVLKTKSSSRTRQMVKKISIRGLAQKILVLLIFTGLVTASFLNDKLFMKEILISCFILWCLFLLKTFEKEK